MPAALALPSAAAGVGLLAATSVGFLAAAFAFASSLLLFWLVTEAAAVPAVEADAFAVGPRPCRMRAASYFPLDFASCSGVRPLLVRPTCCSCAYRHGPT